MNRVRAACLTLWTCACSGKLAEFPDELYAQPHATTDAAADAATVDASSTVLTDAGLNSTSPPESPPLRGPDEAFIAWGIGGLDSSLAGTTETVSIRLVPSEHTRINGSSCEQLALDLYAAAGSVLYEVTNWTSKTLVVDVEQTSKAGAAELLVALRDFPFYVADVVRPGNCAQVSRASASSVAALKKAAGNGVSVAPYQNLYVYAQDSSAGGVYDLALKFTVKASY